MPSFHLGRQPDSLVVHLHTGSDFVGYMDYTDENGDAADWPGGTALSLVFADGTSWAATVAGSIATWEVDKAQADARSCPQKVHVLYVNSTDEEIPLSGVAVRHG